MILQYLWISARQFLITVNEGLAGRDDVSDYLGTIGSVEQFVPNFLPVVPHYPSAVLHRLFKDISDTSGRYIEMSTPAKICNASRTKSEILALDERLEGFRKTYLVRSESPAVIQQDVTSPLD